MERMLAKLTRNPSGGITNANDAKSYVFKNILPWPQEANVKERTFSSANDRLT